MAPSSHHTFDVLIVGSGLAGLSAALHLARTHRVAVITKRELNAGSSRWAQGGIAAVMAEGDSFASHVQDTLVAGAGLCDPDATRFVIEHAPENIRWLQQLGVPFSLENGHLHLTREGGHSERRIVHATDATGAAVQDTLMKQVSATPNITLFEHHMLVDLITASKLGLPGDRCLGLYALNEETDVVDTFSAPHTILATGGAGKVYLYTTNPDTATGDGIAAAWRVGCRVGNMEFIQFHPTCLYHPEAKSFLISEAVRGEGGRLVLPDGTRFMPAHDERAELAPRDIVARAIDFEMKKHGLDHVWLDATHLGEAFLIEHFPTIHARCLALGIDIARVGVKATTNEGLGFAGRREGIVVDLQTGVKRDGTITAIAHNDARSLADASAGWVGSICRARRRRINPTSKRPCLICSKPSCIQREATPECQSCCCSLDAKTSVSSAASSNWPVWSSTSIRLCIARR